MIEPLLLKAMLVVHVCQRQCLVQLSIQDLAEVRR